MNELENILAARRQKALNDMSERQNEVRIRVTGYNYIEQQLGIERVKLLRLRLKNDPGADDQIKIVEELVKRKKTALNEAGYPYDYLTIKYQCEKCSDKGYYEESGAFIECDCAKKIRASIQNRESGLPVQTEYISFDKYDPNVFDNSESLFAGRSGTQREYQVSYVLKKAKEYIDNVKNNGSPFSLLLTGPSGTGKSYLSICIAKELMKENRVIRYLTVQDFVKYTDKSHFFSEKEETLKIQEKVKMYENCDVLVLDDLGAEREGKSNIVDFFDILNKRMLMKKPMIISTNLSIMDIAAAYGDRTASRLNGKEWMRIQFFGKDVRYS